MQSPSYPATPIEQWDAGRLERKAFPATTQPDGVKLFSVDDATYRGVLRNMRRRNVNRFTVSRDTREETKVAQHRHQRRARARVASASRRRNRRS